MIFRSTRYLSLKCYFNKSFGWRIPVRVSITNEQGAVVLDTLIQQRIRVTDDRERVHGINLRKMAPQGAPFSHVQTLVKEIVAGKTVVGHGVHSDLEMFGLDKQKFIDISYPDGETYCKFDEQALSNLNVRINSHKLYPSSVKDSKIAMALFQQEKKNFAKMVDVFEMEDGEYEKEFPVVGKTAPTKGKK